MRYRRSNIGGGTYFFTVNLAERSGRLLVDHIARLRDAFRIVKQRHPFHIDAMVVLPDHVHAIVAAGRRRLPDAMDVDQSRILPAVAERRAHQRQPARQGRTRNMATPVLGTHPSRRGRFSPPRGLYPLQPRQARVCRAPIAVASFHYSSIHSEWSPARRLGHRYRIRRCRQFRRIQVGVTKEPQRHPGRREMLGFVPHPNLHGLSLLHTLPVFPAHPNGQFHWRKPYPRPCGNRCYMLAYSLVSSKFRKSSLFGSSSFLKRKFHRASMNLRSLIPLALIS